MCDMCDMCGHPVESQYTTKNKAPGQLSSVLYSILGSLFYRNEQVSWRWGGMRGQETEIHIGMPLYFTQLRDCMDLTMGLIKELGKE